MNRDDPEPGDDSDAFVIPAAGGAGDTECDHESATLLGSDGGGNRYHQCAECESVIVVGGPPQSPPPEDDTDDGGDRHPLIEGLTIDSNPHTPPEHDRSTGSFFDRLRNLFR